VPHERKRESKKPGGRPEECPCSQLLHDREGAQDPEDESMDAGADKAAEDAPSLSHAEPRKDTKAWHFSHFLGTDWKLPISLGPVQPPLFSSLSSNKAVGHSWELSPPKSFQIHDVHVSSLPQQSLFRRYMDLKAEKRLAGRKERRSRFGEIHTRKCYQFGEIFSPFQALATTEMRKLVFPTDLPMSSHLQRMGIPCATEGNLQDLSLSSAELGLGKNDSSREKEKAASHIKTPLFPPIIALQALALNDNVELAFWLRSLPCGFDCLLPPLFNIPERLTCPLPAPPMLSGHEALGICCHYSTAPGQIDSKSHVQTVCLCGSVPMCVCVLNSGGRRCDEAVKSNTAALESVEFSLAPPARAHHTASLGRLLLIFMQSQTGGMLHCVPSKPQQMLSGGRKDRKSATQPLLKILTLRAHTCQGLWTPSV
ncbi:hypothetical protein J0S82_005603, partial [Galemys pyrenaicus]